MMNNIKKFFVGGIFSYNYDISKQSFSENLIVPNEGFSAGSC